MSVRGQTPRGLPRHGRIQTTLLGRCQSAVLSGKKIPMTSSERCEKGTRGRSLRYSKPVLLCTLHQLVYRVSRLNNAR